MPVGFRPGATCFVLARGGSKRIPGKNMRNFNGHPLVSWPVRAAVCSGLFDKVYISTDSVAIEGIAVDYGATSLGLRPAVLANDYTGTAEVINYCLNTVKKTEMLSECICCLYGTSAFITGEILQEGLSLLQKDETECVLALAPYKHPIERALVASCSGTFEYLHPENVAMRTQDCVKAYHDIGLFYWAKTKNFLALQRPAFSRLRKSALIVPSTQAVDIDTEEDWAFAEQLATILRRQKTDDEQHP